MKAFVLGRSGCGKTPFAKRVAAATGTQHVMASEWVRSRFPWDGRVTGTRDEQVAALTTFSVEELRRNPAVCVEFIASRHDLAKPSIVEGVRNPFDFIRLFDPRTDLVAFLEDRGNALVETAFEGGLRVIREHLSYLRRTGLVRASDGVRAVEYRWGKGAEPGATPADRVVEVPNLDGAIEDFTAVFKDALAKVDPGVGPLWPPSLRPTRVHANVAPLRAHVRKEFLYGMDPAHVGSLVPCTVFAVSSYGGSTPTLKILLEDGAVFSYLPPDALVDPARRKEPQLALADLAYHNCPSEDICVHAFDELAGPVLAYLKHHDVWIQGEYHFTVDWYLGNDLLHFVSLENGQFAFLPHHKLKFKRTDPGFEPYRKIRRTWTV